MIETADYQVQLESSDAKGGKLEAWEDGLPILEFASPPEFGGPGGVWSPEHLLVASVSACLMTTFRSMASMSGVDVFSYNDDATGTLQRDENRRYRIEKITLRPRVVVTRDKDTERAERLLHKAESRCLIGRSVSSNIELEPRVELLNGSG